VAQEGRPDARGARSGGPDSACVRVARAALLHRQVSGSDLRIDRTVPSDEGEYVCHGRNPAGVVEASARLTVHSPPAFALKPADQVAEEGSHVLFKCEATGNPTPAKFWSKEGLQVRSPSPLSEQQPTSRFVLRT